MVGSFGHPEKPVGPQGRMFIDCWVLGSGIQMNDQDLSHWLTYGTVVTVNQLSVATLILQPPGRPSCK